MAAAISRRLAFEVLRRVETGGAYASEALRARLARERLRVKREDAALATELVFGTLRRQRLLDALLAPHLHQAPETLDPQVLVALRLGVYQLQFLARVPARAAVHESVELVKAAGKRSAAGLVNAVLRRLAAELPQTDLARMLPRDMNTAERLAVLHSHPGWLVERWLENWGEDRTVALLEANNRFPSLACALPPATPEIPSELARAGIQTEPGRWLRQALRITSGDPAASPLIRTGRIALQDEASQMVALLLDTQPGDRVLDLCAAPGGKTLLLARAAAPGGVVVAADLHAHRLRAMRLRIRRLSACRVCLVMLDGTAALPFSTPFGRILIDTPCSGTGTLARNPEIRWRLKFDDIRELRERQEALLERACAILAPRGRLVYATCSLEPEENEQVVESLLSRIPGLRLADPRPALAPHLLHPDQLGRLIDPAGFFRTTPAEHGTDGFFAAVVEKCP